MQDGRQSPVFGTRNVLDNVLRLDTNTVITKIRMLESEDKKYLNAIEFYGRRQSISSPESNPITRNVMSDAADEKSSNKFLPTVSFVSDLRSDLD